MIGYVIKSTHKRTKNVQFLVCMQNDNMYLHTSIDNKEQETWTQYFKELRKEHSLLHIGRVNDGSYENFKMQLASLLYKEIKKDKRYTVTLYCYMHIVSAESIEPINKIKVVKSFNIIDGMFVEIPDRIQVTVNRYKNYEL